MTPAYILNTMKEFVESITKDMVIGDNATAPNVFIGDLPRKKGKKIEDARPGVVVPEVVKPVRNNQLLEPESDPSSYYPFVLLRLISFTDEASIDDDGATMAVKFYFGTESTDQDAYLDILHLTQVVREGLLKAGTIGGTAEVNRPLAVNIYEEQPYPQWIATMDTTWTIPTVLREVRF